MNKQEFIVHIDELLHQEMLLGPARDDHRLQGLRNIKSDFNYIASNNSKLDAVDIIKKLFKERTENASIYQDNGRQDLWLQENTERNILQKWLPKEPNESEIIDFLNTLTEIPKTKSSFKKFQDACSEKFGQKVDSKIILEFLS